jgi:hypothetical protein
MTIHSITLTALTFGALKMQNQPLSTHPSTQPQPTRERMSVYHPV